MKKIFLFVLVLFVLPFTSWADKKFSMTPEFNINSNDEMAEDDFYNLTGSIKFKFQATDDIELIFKPELDKYDVDVDEISAKISFLEYNSVKVGKFENELTLDDYFGSFKRVFARKSLITREMKDQGYLDNGIGAKYEYRDKNKKGLGGIAHVSYIPSQFEPQISGGIYYQNKNQDKVAGAFVSYYPFINHKGWGSEHSNPQTHNFLGSLFYADYTEKFIYGGELTIGNSLINPVGMINYDPDTDHPAFCGLDLHCGYNFDLCQNLKYLPLLRATMLVPEISEFQCNQVELLWGNQFTYKKYVKLHADGGMGIITKHDCYDDDDLKTKLEWRWTVSIEIEI